MKKKILIMIIIIGIIVFSVPASVYAEETPEEQKTRWILETEYRQASEEQKAHFPDYIQCQMTQEDFEFLCRVVTKECGPSSYNGCVAVACCVFNRVDSEKYPNTVREVLTEKGQFATVVNGDCCAEVSDVVREAVVDAYLNRPLPKNVLFFRADYYFDWGTPYKNIGGNYFSYG